VGLSYFDDFIPFATDGQAAVQAAAVDIPPQFPRGRVTRRYACAAVSPQALVAIPRYVTVRKRVPFFALRLYRSGESKRRRRSARRALTT
jgi:hypothetical protein